MSNTTGDNQLFLIRHAQSQNNASAESQRVCDPAITSLGHQQAVALSEFLSGMDFESVICSAFRRALQTADYVCKAAMMDSEIVVDLHEHGGCYEGWHPGNFRGMPGMTAAEIQEEFGQVIIPEDYPHDGWWQSKDRETDEQSTLRAEKMAKYLESRLARSSGNLACVTHADFLDKLLVEMFGNSILSEESFRDLKNVGVTRIFHDGEKLRFVGLNSVDFLPGELVSS